MIMFWQMIQCIVMCSTAQLVSITLNSAANEPRFTIIKDRVNVRGVAPLLARASAGLLSRRAFIILSTKQPVSATVKLPDLAVFAP